MQRINSRAQLADVARELGVRPDWHEPDEQRVNAFVVGNRYQLDNAMGPDPAARFEPNVIITQDGENVAVVNLATLLAFAAGTYEGR